MKTYLSIIATIILSVAQAQVEVDTRIQFTGPDTERSVVGLGSPATQDAAVTVEASLIGTTTWATATVSGMAITLQPTTPMTAYRDGAVLRFLAPAHVHGPSTLACIGLMAAPLQRPDGLPPARGQIVQGAVVEVVRAGDVWILTNLPERGCPPGTVAIGDRLCIERADQGNTLWFPAADRCTNLGGRLCSWDEFHIACTQYSDQLTGLLDAWEWIDDSSNHANSAVQVGLTNCTAQRWANPNNVTLGHSRCCFVPR